MKKILVLILGIMLFATVAFASNEGMSLPSGFALIGSARGASTMASSVTAIPLSYSFVQKQVGNSSVAPITLANGRKGQLITIQASTIGTGSPTCAITPTLATGWATFTLATAKDSVTLLYVDDTVGWVIVGVKGGTVA